jgi:hypothetical protein
VDAVVAALLREAIQKSDAMQQHELVQQMLEAQPESTASIDLNGLCDQKHMAEALAKALDELQRLATRLSGQSNDVEPEVDEEIDEVDDEFNDDEDFNMDADEIHMDADEEPLGHCVSEAEDNVERKVKQVKARPAKKSTPKNAMFIDSLNSGDGFKYDKNVEYDSDLLMSDVDTNDDRPQKRNRPGQQARRKMWEEKFGEKAKHLVSGKPSVVKREKRVERGPKDFRAKSDRSQRMPGKERDGQRPAKHFAQNGFSEREQQPAMPFKSKSSEPAESLHPSWEAKRLQKQQQLFAKPQGTKIVFGDD